MTDKTREKLPELPAPHRFWPHVPIDGYVYTADQMRDYGLASRSAALEEAAKVAKGHKIEGYVPPEDGSARDYYNAAGEDIATAILKLDNSGSASVGGGQG